ncbi:MAG TPA: hypothetical protein VFZ95_00890 [Steroidobacteraceae bacterium]
MRTIVAGRATPDRIFFTGMGLVMLATVLVGFGPTFFWRPGDAPPLTRLLQLHGLSATLWMLLFLAQTGLVAAHRTDLHRKLGAAGIAIALGLVVTGWMVSVIARGWTASLVFSAGALLMFAGYLVAALRWRHDPATHKRLMVLATLAVLAPAVSRLGLPFVAHNSFGPNFAVLAFLVPMVVYDLRTRRGHIHAALAWGGSIFILMLPGRLWLKSLLS